MPKELKKDDDRTRLRGTWVVTKCNLCGVEKAITEANVQSFTFDDRGGVQIKYKGTTESEWVIVLDQGTAPRRMGWRRLPAQPPDGDDCVYAFTKDDRLIISFGRHGTPPPNSVEPGPNATVREFKRADAK